MRNAIIIVLMYSFCFLVFFCISRYEPLGACIWRDHLKEGFLRLRVFFMGGGGLGGAYFTEFYGFIVSTNVVCILQLNQL